MLGLEDWDTEAFAQSVETARTTVEETAYIIVSARKRADWESHRPGVELIFYLALIDYETKVMVQRLIKSPEDRYVWEKYLALHLHEVLEAVPKAISGAIREMSREGTASHADPEIYKAAAREFRESIKLITKDTEFMRALKLIRNSVAAHHMDSKSTMDPSVYWMLTSATQRKSGGTPLAGQILEYSVKAAFAVQDFSRTLSTKKSHN